MRVEDDRNDEDKYFRQQRRPEVNWNVLPHPSTDRWGRPIHNAFDYKCRLQASAMLKCPALPPPNPMDYDDELIEPEPHQKKFDPTKLENIPSVENLRASLPPELHRFLDKSCKKDCRVWLWKNEAGRRARAAKAYLEEQQKNSRPSVNKARPSTLRK